MWPPGVDAQAVAQKVLAKKEDMIAAGSWKSIACTLVVWLPWRCACVPIVCRSSPCAHLAVQSA
eukprot:8650503-Lingulodinium_polyedra.AAC.1